MVLIDDYMDEISKQISLLFKGEEDAVLNNDTLYRLINEIYGNGE